MTTVVLWSGKNDAAAWELLGRPVWQRALAAARGLRPKRVLWLGAHAPPELEPFSPRASSSLKGDLLVMPAALPCITARSLTELRERSRRQAAALRDPNRPETGVLSAPAPLWKATRDPSGAHWSSFLTLARRLQPCLFFPREEDELLVVETADDLRAARTCLRRRKLDELLRRGVVLPDPDQVLVDPEVSVGPGTRLHPWVILEGTTRIGRDVSVSSFSHVVDSVIGDGTTVLDHCFIRSSRIGKGVQIGPFAHLRPDSDVGTGAKVGNFVELKNTRLRDGAKAPHLSYLGDSDIGKGTNVGAGTITCNYDGVRKHRTIVGDGAFIGSDVQLVAPVRVGKGAYVAAGSCIVSDVPAHALALARSRQLIKPGWAKARAGTARKTRS